MVKNLLKKGCLVVSVLLGLGSNVLAQETSVTFNVSDGGKTMTISGQGDLTTYKDVSDELKFTETGAEKVGTNNNQHYNNPVGTSAVYNAATSYYAYYPKKIASLYPDYAEATATYFWNEEKIGSLFHNEQKDNVWGWYKVELNDEVDLSGEWWSNYATDSEGNNRILISDFKNSDYFSTTLSNVTFKDNMKQYLYVISDNKYVKLAEDAVYDKNETYYYWDASSKDATKVNFGAITQDEMIRMGYLEHPIEGLAEMLKYELTKSNTFETIRFVNNGTGAMTIDKDIVKAILYPATANSVLTTLDLGAATCKDFSNETFAADGVNGTLALTNLTLPLTNKTSVLSEKTGTNVDKMVVPTQVISKLNPVPTTVTIPEGYDRVGNEAFANSSANSSITNINFPNSLTLIGESAFLNCTKIASIKLNEGLENIGKKAFMGTSLTALHFPSTLQIIHDEAFRDCFIYGLKFNAGLKFIGKGAFALHRKDKAETTLEIPASMRYIGAIAFGNREYQDVFFYGENAPLMPFGTIESWQGTGSAFDEITLMGNNGFDPAKGDIRDDAMTGYANRENYKNHGVYFCLLHYPKDLTDEQRAAYTDITRVYKTVEEGQKFYYGQNEHNPYSYHEVGQETEELKFSPYTAPKRTSLGFQDTYLGRQYIWPSQDEWRRSYVVNSLGYNWNGKDKYLPTLSKEDLNVLAYAGYKVADDTHSADEATGYYKLDDLRMMAHMGTRQFPLVNEDVNVDKEPEEEPTYPINIKGGQWWTICVPFNMTKAQVDNVFGKDTHVCRFNKVERVVNSEKKEKSIKLYFTNDVYVHKSTKDKEGHYTTSTGTPVADDDIVIYAHESYMIYPKNNSDDPNGMYNISDYTLVTGSPLPTLVEATEQFTGGAKESASGDASWNKEYRFVGNYQTEVAVAASEQGNSSEETVARDIKNVTVPQYSYIYAKKKNTSNAQFWFYTGTEMLWGANKCVVQATARDGGKSDFNTYFGGNGSARAKELSFFGTDDEVTGIENVEIIAGNENDTQIVYNLNGQVVNGNLNSLQKGIYIKNGKKFMVK
nr:leucine-rich repeat domain-containing protein [uncultured Prevotella sp.]